MFKNVLGVSFLTAAAACCVPPVFALTPAQADAQLPFARAQQMVDIGGRRLNLYCSGSGPVTVVFDAHSGGGASTWLDVQPEVAKRTRACVYDRAGIGYSDPSQLPSTSGNAVNDLHKLLGAAGIAAPYVLVGSSFGGANVQLYTYRYPQEVKGLVLVEGQHEDEIDRTNTASQGKLKQMFDMGSEMQKECGVQSRKGFVPGSEMWGNCVGAIPANHGRALAAAELAIQRSPAYWDARISEEDNFGASGAELRAARRPFGDLPLVVLARGVSPYAVPGRPQSALNKAVEAENLAIQKEIAAFSTRGKLRVVPGAGHIIHANKPEAVVKAIEEVLAQIKR